MTEQDLGLPEREVNLPLLSTARTYGPLTTPAFLRRLGGRDMLSVENPLSLARLNELSDTTPVPRRSP